jgi:hypothetical protein
MPALSCLERLCPKSVNTAPHNLSRRLNGPTLTFDCLSATLYSAGDLTQAGDVALLAARVTWSRNVTMHVLGSAHVLRMK